MRRDLVEMEPLDLFVTDQARLIRFGRLHVLIMALASKSTIARQAPALARSSCRPVPTSANLAEVQLTGLDQSRAARQSPNDSHPARQRPPRDRNQSQGRTAQAAVYRSHPGEARGRRTHPRCGKESRQAAQPVCLVTLALSRRGRVRVMTLMRARRSARGWIDRLVQGRRWPSCGARRFGRRRSLPGSAFFGRRAVRREAGNMFLVTRMAESS